MKTPDMQTEQISQYGYKFGEFYGGMIKALQDQGFSIDVSHALAVSIVEKVISVAMKEILKTQSHLNFDQLLTQALKNSTPAGNA